LEYDVPRGPVREYAPFVFGGTILVMAFAFAGHYMGQNAIAHNAAPDVAEASFTPITAPVSTLLSKGSLLPEDETFGTIQLKWLEKQTVVGTGKGDFVNPDPVQVPPPKVKVAKAKEEPAIKRMKIVPTAVQIEKSFKLKRPEKQKVIAQRRVRLAEENCLARAIYFEARSESEMGQLAVARVILNRVKNPEYPNTICGVVYQGTQRRNSCQFSFACDGLPDDVKQPAAWAQAKKVAQRAIAGESSHRIMSAATNYHADYVRPKWAKNMRKLVKIGRHIFYSDGS
jgi:spore germination cell wall hydrolase CwlJ-like protein